MRDVSGFSVGLLIALFERAVGLYASLVNINAYHQPGVEAGKKAAAVVLSLQTRATAHLVANPGRPFTAPDLAAAIDRAEESETIFKILTHLAANHRGVVAVGGTGTGTLFQHAG